MKMEKELLKKIEKLINKYIREELKVKKRIDEEWEKEKDFSYPRIYSNQYFAFIELMSFWNELKEMLKHGKRI